MVFDYLDGGAEAEITLRENCRAFESVTFRPRQAVAVPACDLRTRVLGIDVSFPALLAPVGYSRLMHPGGEVAAARAAGAAGTAYGANEVFQFWTAGKTADMGAKLDWHQALNLPGAGEMQYLKNLMESRAYLTRVPDHQQ